MIDVPECDLNVTKRMNPRVDIIQENFPSLARQTNVQVQDTENTTKIFSRKATPRHIIVRFTRAEMKEKC